MSKEKQGEPLTDCFAYNASHEKCMVLYKTYCLYEECKFYKTQKQIEEQNKKLLN